jgi:AcrR family transcriptional regulator
VGYAEPVASAREQGKQATRARISDVATTLFLERGFDHVTVNDVAAAAGVSKVTVFTHFPRKEDMLIDRGPEAACLIVAALRDRTPGTSPVQAFRRLAETLARERHQLTGLDPASRPFLAAVAGSPALLARARELAAELEAVLAAELGQDNEAPAHPELLAALIIAAYRTVVTDTTSHVLDGDTGEVLLGRHRHLLATAFEAVEAAETAINSPPASTPARGPGADRLLAPK